MAAHSRFPATRQSQHSWFPSITAISTLGLSILEGLGEFGLAANGMCITSSAQTESSPTQIAPDSLNASRQ
jgi:hypothetical protein